MSRRSDPDKKCWTTTLRNYKEQPPTTTTNYHDDEEEEEKEEKDDKARDATRLEPLVHFLSFFSSPPGLETRLEPQVCFILHIFITFTNFHF